ncbi:MAG: class I adenylate-forming enzyme family protein [Alphaproteobacteria bacterium]
MLVHEFLVKSARKWGEKAAIIAGSRQISFAQLDDDSDRLAVEFQRLGIVRGDRVAVMLENSIEFVIALWATLKAGAVFLPVNHATKGGTLGFILSDAEAKCLIVQPQFRLRVQEATLQAPPNMAVIWTKADDGQANLLAILAQPHTRPTDTHLIDQDLALLIYTSGSTGKPKGVMLTHHSVCNNAWAISTYLGNVPEDIVLNVLPMSFGYGLFQIITGAYTGYTVVLERSFAFPAEVLKQLIKHNVTGLPGVPALFTKLLELAPFEKHGLLRLRYVTNAAAPMPPRHIAKFRETLPRVQIFSMYGLTECTRVCYMDPARLDEKTASVGRAMPNCEVWIVDADGNRCGPGETGELVVRGSNLMRGYWRRPEDTAKALRDGPIEGEKLLYTGDLFYADADGDLFFSGRVDDVFKCRGEKVSPRVVENALYECDDIAEAAVIGVADPIDGMAVKAFVVLRENAEMNVLAIRKFCAARLETWLVPKFVEFCQELPKTESGKITRRALRERLASEKEGL